MKNKSYFKEKEVPEKKDSKEQIKDFLLEYATDDKLFETEDKEHRMIFTAGFIRGVSWSLKQGGNIEGIKKSLEAKKEKLKEKKW